MTSPLSRFRRMTVSKFITDNQWTFKYGATQEFGLRDDHFEEDDRLRCLLVPYRRGRELA